MARQRRKKRRTHLAKKQEDNEGTPQSFVISAAKGNRNVKQLTLDFRKVMEPNTATRLRVRKSNKIKDFLHVAGPLGVTHFVMFNRTESGTNMRIARVPHGPTLQFRVQSYSFIRDVLNSQRRPISLSTEFLTSPLVVLNNFPTQSNHMKILVTILRNMFPAINIEKMKIGEARRVILFNYQPDTQLINVRHYVVKVTHSGLTRSISKLVRTKLPSMGSLEDISEYVLGNYASDSEGEDMPDNHVHIPRPKSSTSDQKSVRLREIGPRLDIRLVKIQQDFCGGDVLYHEFIHKTPEEVAMIKKEREKKVMEKKKRIAEQEANVERKQREKSLQREAAIAHQLEVEKRKKEMQAILNDKQDVDEEEDDEDNVEYEFESDEEERFEDLDDEEEEEDDDEDIDDGNQDSDEEYENLDDENDEMDHEQEEEEDGGDEDDGRSDEEEDMEDVEESDEEYEAPPPEPKAGTSAQRYNKRPRK